MSAAPVRALVTGGAGFIGSALAERLLAEGLEIDVVDDLTTGSLTRLSGARSHGRAFRFHQLDVAQRELPELLDKRRPQVVFHLAASTGAARALSGPVGDAQVGLLGTLSVLEAARRSGVEKVVWSASAPLAIEAAAPTQAHDLVERSILDYLRFYRSQFGIEFTALALGCVYGPAGHDPGPVGRLAAGQAPIGDAKFDLVYLDDAIDAFVRASRRGSGLVVPVTAGAVLSSTELVAAFERGEIPSVPVRRPPPWSRAELQLGWSPFTSLADGLARARVRRDAAEHGATP